ncbi:hypothetical protein P4C99_11265 [Pontiellaceae bacterium B1224]|nr:hypothetical protein [Pontiellaceae bacterium B1224]
MKLNISNRSSFLPVSTVGLGLGFNNLPATDGIKVSINGRSNNRKSGMGSKGRRSQG